MRVVVPVLYLLSRANANLFTVWFGRGVSQPAEPVMQETAIPTFKSIKDFNFSTTYESDDSGESKLLTPKPEADNVHAETLQQDQSSKEERILPEQKMNGASLLIEFSDDEDGSLFGISDKPVTKVEAGAVSWRQEPTYPEKQIKKKKHRRKHNINPSLLSTPADQVVSFEKEQEPKGLERHAIRVKQNKLILKSIERPAEVESVLEDLISEAAAAIEAELSFQEPRGIVPIAGEDGPTVNDSQKAVINDTEKTISSITDERLCDKNIQINHASNTCSEVPAVLEREDIILDDRRISEEIPASVNYAESLLFDRDAVPSGFLDAFEEINSVSQILVNEPEAGRELDQGNIEEVPIVTGSEEALIEPISEESQADADTQELVHKNLIVAQTLEILATELSRSAGELSLKADDSSASVSSSFDCDMSDLFSDLQFDTGVADLPAVEQTVIMKSASSSIEEQLEDSYTIDTKFRMEDKSSKEESVEAEQISVHLDKSSLAQSIEIIQTPVQTSKSSLDQQSSNSESCSSSSSEGPTFLQEEATTAHSREEPTSGSSVVLASKSSSSSTEALELAHEDITSAVSTEKKESTDDPLGIHLNVPRDGSVMAAASRKSRRPNLPPNSPHSASTFFLVPEEEGELESACTTLGCLFPGGWSSVHLRGPTNFGSEDKYREHDSFVVSEQQQQYELIQSHRRVSEQLDTYGSPSVDIETVRMSLGRQSRGDGVQHGNSKGEVQEGPLGVIEQQRRSHQDLKGTKSVAHETAALDILNEAPHAASSSSSTGDFFSGIRMRFKTMIADHPFPQSSSSSSIDGPLTMVRRNLSEFFSSEKHRQSYVPRFQPGSGQQHTVSSGSKEEEASSLFPGFSLWIKRFRNSNELNQ